MHKKALTKAAKEEESAKKDKKADDKKKEPKEYKRDEKIINALLSGEKPLIAYADRATDLLELLKLKAEYNLDLVIAGGADAILISEQLAAAKVPVEKQLMLQAYILAILDKPHLAPD